MAGHGGPRPNSGAKPKTYYARQLPALQRILTGIESGFIRIGREQLSARSDAEAIHRAVEQITTDAILAGEGFAVLAKYTELSMRVAAIEDPKSDGHGAKSALIDALERMPGLTTGTDQASTPDVDRDNAIDSGAYRVGPLDYESSAQGFQPVLRRQAVLFPALGGLDDQPPRPGGTPPGGPPPIELYLDGKNFEKNQP